MDPSLPAPDSASEPGGARWLAGWRLALVALLVALAATGGALLRPGVVLFGVDTMAERQPFAGALGDAVPEVANDALADQGQVFYPYYRWVAESWLAGDPPLWNPYVYAGAPGHANAQCGALDPQVLALVALEGVGGKRAFDWGLNLVATLRVLAAFAGTVLLARRLGLGGVGAAFAGLGFALSGFQLLWLNHSLGHVSPYLPWILLALEGVARARRWAGPATAALLCAAVLGGHPETGFYVGFAAGLWALAIARQDLARGARALASLAAGALASAVLLVPFVEYLGLSAAQAIREVHARGAVPPLLLLAWFALAALFVAFARLGAKGGTTWDGPRGWPLAVGGLVLACGGAAPLFAADGWFERASLALAPERFGSPDDYHGPINYLEGASPWLAAPVLVFALAGLLGRGRLARGRLAAALGAGAFLLALEAPGLLEAYRWVPLVGLGATVRLAAVSALFLSLVAGDALESAGKPARVGAFALLAVAFGALAGPRGGPEEFDSPAAESDELIGVVQRPPALVEGTDSVVEVWLASGVSVTGSLEVVATPLDGAGARDVSRAEFFVPLEPVPARSDGQAPPDARWFRTAALVTSRLDEGRWRFELVLSGERGAPVRRMLGESLVVWREERAWGSLACLALALVGLVFSPLPSVRVGLVALAALQGVVFALGANPRVPAEAVYPGTRTVEVVRELQADGHRVFSDASVLPPAAGLAFGLFQLQGYDGMDPRAFNVFRLEFQATANGLLGFNPRGVDLAHPAFRLFGVGQLLLRDRLELPGWECVAGPGEAREAEVFVLRAREPFPRAWIVHDVTDPDDMAARVRAGADPLALACVEEDWRPTSPATRSSVDAVSWTNGTVRATVTTDGDALLVLSEQAFPGWTARVDGESTQVLEADYVFRGVPLTAGTHEVELRYRPRSLFLGAVLSIAGILLALATRVRLA